MARRLTLVATLFALLAAVLWIAFSGDPQSEQADPESGGNRGTRVEDENEAQDPLDPNRSKVEVEPIDPRAVPDDERIPSFRGRVADAEGRALSGVQVDGYGLLGWAAELPDESAGQRAMVRWTTSTDLQGRFQFPEAPQDGLRYLLRFRGPNHAPLLLRNLPATPGRTREVGTVRLTAGVTVRGRVLDAAGSPVANASLQAFQMSDASGRGTATTRAPIEGALVLSDADGNFVIEQLPNRGLRLRATARGHTDGWSAPLHPHGALDSTLDIRLPDSRLLTGKVTDTDGGPVAAAEVSYRADPRETEVPQIRYTATTDADGRFELLLPQSYRKGVITATAASRYQRQERVTLDELENLTLALSSLPPLSGRCVDADGNAVAGAEVRLVELRTGNTDLLDLPTAGITTTDGDGRYLLEPDLRGAESLRFQIHVQTEARAQATSPRFTLLDPNRTRLPSLDFTLDAGISLRGKVKDESGTAIADARVLLRKLEFRRPSRLPQLDESRRGGKIVARVSSEADGSFHFPGNPVGDYRVEAFLPGTTPGESEELGLIDAEVQTTVVLRRGSTLSGVVRGPLRELGPLQVLASAPGMEPMDAAVGADGSFRFPNPWPATWTLELRETHAVLDASAFVLGGTVPLARLDGVVTEAGRDTVADLELNFAGLGTVEGVARINGLAASEHRVFLLPMDLSASSDPRIDGRNLMRRTRIAKTDGSGRFRIAGVAPDEYWLVLCRPNTWPEGMFTGGWASADEAPTGLQARRVQVPADGSAESDFLLSTGSLRIVVSNADRELLGASAQLLPEVEGARRYAFALGAAGHRIEGVPTGRYTLLLVSGGQLRSEVPVEVPAGEEAEVSVLLAEPHMLPDPPLPPVIHDGDGY